MVYSNISFIELDRELLKKIRDKCEDFSSLGDRLGSFYAPVNGSNCIVNYYLIPGTNDLLFIGIFGSYNILGITSDRGEIGKETLEKILFRIESISRSRSISSEKRRGIVFAMGEIYKKVVSGKVE